LKGTGWYETDFKKDGKRLLAESGDGGSAVAKDGPGSAAGDDRKDKPAKADKAEAQKSGKKAAVAASGAAAD
jgi:hypothetical protein